ncbi:MAG: hypothetical protein K6A38_08240 [Lachnospiraceae bacterium]|nr:hypothetical protein [Lachnospiraceae bacterium]
MEDFDKMLSVRRPFSCSKCKAGLKMIRSGEYECLNCGNIEYDDFGKVRKYLDENGPQSKEKIILETGVSRKSVNLFLEQRRLEVAPNSEKKLKCVVCGKPIISGLMCPSCENKSKAKTGHALGGSDSTDNKMRFL